jgi:uncharacterized protein (TIGR02217 family)
MAAPVYDPVQLPPNIARGAVGGPTFSTIIVSTASGAEPSRVAQWSQSRYRYTIAQESLNIAGGQALLAFFLARQGRLRGFRFKDWVDYTATNEPLSPTGAPTVQLQKSYASGPVTYVRPIYAPVLSPAATLRKNAGAFAGFTLDVTTGIVTLNAVSSASITGISAANPAVLTVASHPFAVNDLLYITGVAGMTQINTLVGRVTAFTATTITTTINATGFSAWTSGGTATKYLASTDALDWSGQFDTPVRFDQDEMALEAVDVGIRNWQGIQLVELR